MPGIVWFLLGLAGMALAWRWLGPGRLRARPPQLQAWQQAALAARLPQYSRLTEAQRQRLARKVAAFLADKAFYGCNGLEVTDGMALDIAGMACLLDLRDERPPFAALRAVLVYPDAFLVRDPHPDELGLVSDEPEMRIGESWDAQRVILSWADVEAALAGDDGNVVAHEFAHQLDDEAPGAEGAPLLTDYTRWAQVMQPAYEALCREGSPVLDDYACTSPAEFFAVATEAYLQRPTDLRRTHPHLYELLETYFELKLT